MSACTTLASLPMLIDPRGYRIVELVHESSATLVFRAERERGQRPVVLKILKPEASTPAAVASYRHEHDVLQSLRNPGVIEILGLEMVRGLPMLVLEDFGAESLARLHRKQRFPLERALTLASRIADTLSDIHARGIVHGDINPANVLLDPIHDVLKIADFGSSLVLSGTHLAPDGRQGREGTLAYMSPEQTGRMSRPVDHRTDFYSLGVSLYELCTGRLPFASDDPLQLVHSHLARQPVPAHALEPAVPEAVSDVVLKLMAKMPEDRYQDGRGCAHDLRECRRQLRDHGSVQRFVLGQADAVEQFRIVPRLYGREPEVAAMTEAFALAAAGARHLVLVTGAPGIGKSALARALVAPIAHGHGYFVEGKFDQYRRNVPYSAIAQALGGLVGQILTEPEERLERWRSALRAALGPSAQALIELLPDLVHLVGSQPPAPRLGPIETENRFIHAFQCFLEVACHSEHPLVLLLDDLQWADTASLRLVKLMMTDPGVSHLLIVGAYRDSEIDATHPLSMTLEQIGQKVDIPRIELRPLADEHVCQLLADTLQRSLPDCAGLAELLVAKTAGNPFFVNQFLRALHQDRLLTFDRDLRGWRWDLAAIQALGITDNVVELMLARMRKLPTATQRMLELAACAGNLFDTTTLSIICESSPAELDNQLTPAIEMGLLQPSAPLAVRTHDGDGAPAASFFVFAHDRVQQAAYGLTTDDKAATHLRIARLLERALSPAEREQRLFELAEHFALGAALIDEPGERLAIAALCLAAGIRAKDTSSYDTARRFLRTGLMLMPGDGWRSSYELMRDLALAAVEVEYRDTDFEAARRLSDEILANARDLLDKVAVYDFQLRFHIAQNQPGTAIETAFAVLAMLGFEVPSDPAARLALDQELRARLDLDEAGFAALERLPALSDPRQAAILRILLRVSPTLLFADPALWRLFCGMMVEQCMRSGHSSLAATAYGQYAALVGALYQDFERNHRYGALAVRLIERFPDPQVEVQVGNQFCVFVLPWSQPLGDAVEPLRALVQRGLDVGDLEFGMFCAANYLFAQIILGAPLDGLHREALAYVALIERHHMPFHSDFARTQERMIRALIGLPAAEDDPGPPVYNPAFLMRYEWHTQAMVSSIMGDHEAALAISQQSADQGPLSLSLLLVAEHAFCRSLAILAALPDDPDRASALLAEVEQNQASFERWAARAPMNFRHQHTLIEAERARRRGDCVAAMAAYDDAIQGAHDLGRLRDEALACERAASFYAELGRQRFARMYIAEACDAYRRWGAHAKVRQLESRHSWLVQRRAHGAPGASSISSSASSSSASSSTGGQALDFESVVRASQALSSQLVLEALLAELMRIIIENAGAQRGYLLLTRGGSLVVEARGDIITGSYHALPSLHLSSHAGELALAAVGFVARTHKSLVLRNAAEQEPFAQDPYVRTNQTRSILCAPIGRHGELVGIIYLENNLAFDAFTPGRVEVVQTLAAQAAISIDNARLLRTLELSKQEVEHANRNLYRANQELERLLHNITHDLKEPLRAVHSFSELVVLRYRDTLEDQGREYLARVLQASQRLGDLIEAMRVITKIRSSTSVRQNTTGAELVHDALSRLAPLIDQTRAEVRVAADLPALTVDRRWAAEAVYQLVYNALLFTPAGQQPQIDIGAYQGSEGAGLLIQDRGIGVPAEDTDRLFDLFRRAVGRDVPGTGVGLTIVRQVAMRHDGAAWLRPRAGGGTEACVVFGR
jgi:predicted ATPase/signal transduction histidine kinase